MNPFDHKNFHFTASTFPVYTYVVHTQVDPTNLDLNTLHMLSALTHVPQQVTECTHQCLPEEAWWLPWLGEGSVGTVQQQKQLMEWIGCMSNKGSLW